MNVRRQIPRLKGGEKLKGGRYDGMEVTTTVATAVLDQLRQLEHTQYRPNEILYDFARLSLATLESIPRHAKSVAQTGRLAEDDDETMAMFNDCMKKYGRCYQHIQNAFALMHSHSNLYAFGMPRYDRHDLFQLTNHRRINVPNQLYHKKFLSKNRCVMFLCWF